MVGKELLRNHKLAITMDWLGDGSAIEERRFNSSLEEIFIFAVLFCTKSIFYATFFQKTLYIQPEPTTSKNQDTEGNNKPPGLKNFPYHQQGINKVYVPLW